MTSLDSFLSKQSSDSVNNIPQANPSYSCLSNITKAIDDVIHSRFSRIDLPDKRMLRIVRLYEGKVISIGDIDWFEEIRTENLEIKLTESEVSFNTRALIKSLRVGYSCVITAFGSDIRYCPPVDITAKDVKVTMRVHFDRDFGRRIRVTQTKLISGKYILRAIIFGNAIKEEDEIPLYIKPAIADIIQGLVNNSKPKLPSNYDEVCS
jgi:hypothetical protein